MRKLPKSLLIPLFLFAAVALVGVSAVTGPAQGAAPGHVPGGGGGDDGGGGPGTGEDSSDPAPGAPCFANEWHDIGWYPSCASCITWDNKRGYEDWRMQCLLVDGGRYEWQYIGGEYCNRDRWLASSCG